MSTLAEYEKSIRALAFAKETSSIDAMGSEVSSLYRRFVRGGCARAIKRAIPVTMAVMGEEKVDELLAHFFENAPPQTKLYRAIPMDFSAHIGEREDLELALRELIHFEILELEVLYAEDADDDEYTKIFDEKLAAYMHPSARLCAYQHPVHVLKKDAKTLPKPSPRFLVAYRSSEKFVWLRIEQEVAVLIGLCAQMPIHAALDALCKNDQKLRAFCASQLSNLASRGVIHGFYKVTE